jgi:protein SCO1/2
MTRNMVISLALTCLLSGVLFAGLVYRQMNRPVATVGQAKSEPIDGYTIPSEWLTEFELTDQSGERFSSEELDGHPYVVSFFYASCPNACTAQNQKIGSLARDLGPEGVRFVAITCDPQLDTPEVLAEYAKLHNANPNHRKFLTGDMLHIRRIASEMYSLHIDRREHQEHLAVVDKWGKVRGHYQWNIPEKFAEMRHVLEELLKEKPPEDLIRVQDSGEKVAAKPNEAEVASPSDTGAFPELEAAVSVMPEDRSEKDATTEDGVE